MMRFFRMAGYIILLLITGFLAKLLHSYEIFLLLVAMIIIPVLFESIFFLFYRKTKFNINSSENEIVKGDKSNIIIEIKSLVPIRKCHITFTVKSRFYEEYKTEINFPVAAFFMRSVVLPFHFKEVGRYNISLTNIILTDIFGVVYKNINIKKSISISVFPNLVDSITFNADNAEIDINWAINNYRSSGGDISGVREYIPGDRLNTIHWKTSAKTNDIFVKDYEKNGSEEYIILFDFMMDYIENSFDFLYSAGRELIKYNRTFYVMWLCGGNEDLSLKYITGLDEFNDLIEKLYNSYPIYKKGLTLNAFKKHFGNSRALYIGENRELI